MTAVGTLAQALCMFIMCINWPLEVDTGVRSQNNAELRGGRMELGGGKDGHRFGLW